MLFGPWKSATIAKDGQLSGEVDLEANYKYLMVLMPTIDAAKLSVRVAKESGGTYYPVHGWLDSDADLTVLQESADEVTSKALLFLIGGAQFVKLYASAAQTTEAETFYVRGVN